MCLVQCVPSLQYPRRWPVSCSSPAETARPRNPPSGQLVWSPGAHGTEVLCAALVRPQGKTRARAYSCAALAGGVGAGVLGQVPMGRQRKELRVRRGGPCRPCRRRPKAEDGAGGRSASAGGSVCAFGAHRCFRRFRTRAREIDPL